MTVNDAYDRVKLSLQRLNCEWSLTPEILSPHADMMLRRDPGDHIAQGVGDLAEAYAHMAVAASRFLDPACGPYDMHGDGHLITQWNIYFGSAGDMLMFEAIDSLSDRERSKIMTRFNNALANASSMIQLMG